MRLILKQYLSSLRERDELDALLPDLLSQMGMIVTSTPGRGTKQNGVDVAAIRKTSNNENITYLFSIKAGDLNRADWNGNHNQALRPSLDEIIDNYFTSKLSEEQRNGKVVICLCFGGVVNETIQGDVNGYITKNTTNKISYEIWNGDKLALLIMEHLLNEALLPEPIRANLRKSLAMIDDPESSAMYFREVIKELISEGIKRKGDINKNKITTFRQINICLWILHSWCRDLNNLESAYLSSEFCILACWDSIKELKKNKSKQITLDLFQKTIDQYLILNKELLIEKISLISGFKNGLTSGVYPDCQYAINFKAYDIIGRYATYGIWLVWQMRKNQDSEEPVDELAKMVHFLQKTISELINNNLTLCTPFKDDNSIELALAVYFLSLDTNFTQFIKDWVFNITDNIEKAFKTGRYYPRTIYKYADFLEIEENDEYKKEVTKASVLYPLLAIFSALLNENETYKTLQDLKEKYLSHSNIQIWFPSESSEKFYYNGENTHGLVLSNVPIKKTPESFLYEMINEAKITKGYKELSAIENDYHPIIFLASRVNRFPIPLMTFAEEFEDEINLRTKDHIRK